MAWIVVRLSDSCVCVKLAPVRDVGCVGERSRFLYIGHLAR